MHYTYILECLGTSDEVKTLYVGLTSNLRERPKYHQQKKVISTKSFSRVKLVYYEACLSKKDARVRELRLKSGFGRGYIKRRLEDYLSKRAVSPP